LEWDENIKTDVTVRGYTDWGSAKNDKIQWWAFEDAAMNIKATYKARPFLTN
jgi:hypothetical protein